MSELEDRLRAVMHAAVDGEEIPGYLLRLVTRRQRRRRAFVAGVAALTATAAVVSAVIAVHDATTPTPAPPSGHPTPRPSTEHPTPGPSTEHPTPGPSTSHHSARTTRLPTRLTGLPIPAGTNLQLLVSTGPWAALYSTATGRSQRIKGLPPTAYFFDRVEGGWTANQFSGSGPQLNGPSYFIADGSLTATRIGVGIESVASDRAGAVWMTTIPSGTQTNSTTSDWAQLVSTAGKPLGPQYRLPIGYFIYRGVGSYLLLYPSSNGPSGYLLWDPRTGKVIRNIENVDAAGPDQIAWSPDCRACRVQILNVLTGTTVTTPIPGGQPTGLFGTFTDDGKLLAVQLRSGAIEVYDTQSHTLTEVPGTILASDVGLEFGWLSASHRLVIQVEPPHSGRSQIAYWQPGDTGLMLAAILMPASMSGVFAGMN